MLKNQSTLSHFQSISSVENYSISSMPADLSHPGETSFAIYIRYLGPSMNPTLLDSDLLEVLPCRMGQIQIGDVIVFRTYYCEDYTVHRAIEVEERGIKARGDNNDSMDPFWVQPHHIVGKVLSLWRGQKQLKILSGKPGLIWAYFIRTLRELDQVISPKIHPIYRSMSTNNKILKILSKKYQPHIQQFNSNGRLYTKVVIGSRVVGLYDNDLDKWQIRRPFRLLVNEEMLEGIRKKEMGEQGGKGAGEIE